MPKIVQIPRVIALARYADIPSLLVPKGIGAKQLSDLINEDCRILINLFEYLEKFGEFKGSKTELFKICCPDKNKDKRAVDRTYKKIWKLGTTPFILPKRINEQGDVNYTRTTTLFDVVEDNSIENKTDLRIKVVIILSKKEVLDYYSNHKKAHGKNAGYVKSKTLTLEEKTKNNLKLTTKQNDLFNRIYDYLDYVEETKLVSQNIYSLDFDLFCSKIDCLGQLKKNKKRLLPRIINILDLMNKQNIKIIDYNLEIDKNKIYFTFKSKKPLKIEKK